MESYNMRRLLSRFNLHNSDWLTPKQGPKWAALSLFGGSISIPIVDHILKRSTCRYKA